MNTKMKMAKVIIRTIFKSAKKESNSCANQECPSARHTKKLSASCGRSTTESTTTATPWFPMRFIWMN